MNVIASCQVCGIAATVASAHAAWSTLFVPQGGSDLLLASKLAHPRGLPLAIWMVASYSLLLVLMLVSVLAGRKLAKTIRAVSALISAAGLVLTLVLLWIEIVVVRAASRPCVAAALAVACVFSAVLLRGLPVSTRAWQAAVAGVALVVGAGSFPYLLLRGGLPDIRVRPASTLAANLVGPESHVTGDSRAPLVVEFADFECQACALQASYMQPFLEAHGKDLRFAFRHLPLTQHHPRAFQAAEAAECAANDNRFWEMTRLIYLRRDLDYAALERYAADLHVDQKPFDSCLTTGQMRDRVEKDSRDARAAGVRATPTFVVGGLIIEGTIDPGKLAEIARREQNEQADNSGMAAQNNNAVPGKTSGNPLPEPAPCNTATVCK